MASYCFLISLVLKWNSYIYLCILSCVNASYKSCLSTNWNRIHFMMDRFNKFVKYQPLKSQMPHFDKIQQAFITCPNRHWWIKYISLWMLKLRCSRQNMSYKYIYRCCSRWAKHHSKSWNIAFYYCQLFSLLPLRRHLVAGSWWKTATLAIWKILHLTQFFFTRSSPLTIIRYALAAQALTK